MSTTRWVISIVLLAHVAAMLFAAVPARGSIAAIGPPRHVDRNLLAAALTPRLDATAQVIERASNRIRAVVDPLSRLSRNYLRRVGLGQNWTMFGSPPLTDEYVRIRYYVARGEETETSEPQWRATELVMPAHRDDRMRLGRSFWLKDYDKAIFKGVDAFLDQRRRDVARGDTEKPPDDLAPIARYFRERFSRERLLPNEFVTHTEVWFGTAPIPPLGSPVSAALEAERLAALRVYYAGAIEERSVGRGSRGGPSEREADIQWSRLYSE